MTTSKGKVAYLLALALAPAVVGCGGGEKDEDKFAKYTSQDVQARFEQLGGVKLGIAGSGPDSSSLSLPTGQEGTAARQRYGSFLLTVSKTKTAMDSLRKSAGEAPTKVVDNVLLQALGGSEPKGFERAARIVGSLGTPVAQVKLPPEDVPCDKAGIDPDGGEGKEGTCRLGQQTLKVVDPGTELTLPQATLSGLTGKIGKTLTSRRFGLVKRVRAKGGFVALRVRVENTGNEPLSSLRPDLVVNGKRYAPDDRNSFYLADSPFPIQPGASATAAFLFDVPLTADNPRSAGALEFPADAEPTTIEYAGTVARIRLLPSEAAGAISGSSAGDDPS